MDRQFFIASAQAMERSMYCIARSYLRCEADCEDALQNALLRAWEKRSTLREERYFRTWLTRILINSCKETLRRQRRESPSADFPEAAAPQGGNPALWESLRALDEKYRVIVVLHYRDGYSVREIASILRVPESTVKTRLFRARQQLKSLLEREEIIA